MARSFSNAKVLSALVVDGMSLAIHRYGSFMVKTFCSVFLAINERNMKKQRIFGISVPGFQIFICFSDLLVS